jgi:hypothetical protein
MQKTRFNFAFTFIPPTKVLYTKRLECRRYITFNSILYLKTDKQWLVFKDYCAYE